MKKVYVYRDVPIILINMVKEKEKTYIELDERIITIKRVKRTNY